MIKLVLVSAGTFLLVGVFLLIAFFLFSWLTDRFALTFITKEGNQRLEKVCVGMADVTEYRNQNGEVGGYMATTQKALVKEYYDKYGLVERILLASGSDKLSTFSQKLEENFPEKKTFSCYELLK